MQAQVAQTSPECVELLKTIRDLREMIQFYELHLTAQSLGFDGAVGQETPASVMARAADASV